MNDYLSTIHTRSDSHKKRFALAVSGGVTLLIFGVWTFVNFGLKPSRLAAAEGMDQSALVPASSQTAGAAGALGLSGGSDDATDSAVSPFQALGGSISDAWGAVKSQVSTAVSNIRSRDLEADYNQVKADAMNTNTNGN